MKSGISMELVANSGVYIQSSNTTILIDGIFEKDNYFSDPPKELRKSVVGMKGKYSDADYVLFSHKHEDHFSEKYLKEYLRNNNIRKILLPNISENENISDQLNDGQAVSIDLSFGEASEVNIGERDKIRFFRTKHLGGQEYNNVQHYSFVISLNDRSFMFVSDADVIEANFDPELIGKKLDAIFVNVLFFKSEKGQEILDKFLKPGTAVIYHLPFKDDDKFNMHELAEQLKKNSNWDYEVILLKDPMQKLAW